MTSLSPADDILTLINTFTVAPERAEELLRLLSKATEETMRHLPGFVSANLHVSDDRCHVANYAQWRSKADFQAMLSNPAAQKHMKEASDLAESHQPVTYKLRETHDRSAAAAGSTTAQ